MLRLFACRFRRFRRRSPDAYLALPLHDLLTDDADWDEPAWTMEPKGLAELAVTLGWLHGQLPQGFEFFAAWPPDDIDTTVDVSIDELVALVRESRIGTRSRYRVAAPATR